MRDFGVELAKQSLPKKPRVSHKPKTTKEWRRERRRFKKSTKGVNFDPETKASKPVEHMDTEQEDTDNPEWKKVKFDRETDVALEAVVLVRTTADSALRLFLSGLKNVNAYVDGAGALVLRPARAGAKAGQAGSLPAASEGVGGVRRPRKGSPAAKGVVLGGSTGLNPAREGTKRYFLVESLLQGGTAVEIVKRADKLARKGGYKKGAITKFMPANTKDVRELAEYVARRVEKAGKTLRVKVKGKVIEMAVPSTVIVLDNPEY